MWKWLSVILGALRSSIRSRHELALENLALRQQLATLKFRGSRPRLSDSDRLFWVVLKGRIVELKKVGGLHHHYMREAA